MIGKIVGGTLGLLSFGPMGFLLGVTAGHLYDHGRAHVGADFLHAAQQAGVHIGGNMDQVAFTVGVVVLGAKMAKVDGQVTRREIDAFKRVFSIPPQQEAQLGALFDHAKRDAGGYEAYAAQLARVFRHRPAVLEELLTGLILIAAADGDGIAPVEEQFLRDIARLFGFSAYEFGLIAARSGKFHARNNHANGNASPRPDADDPYQILGVTVDSAPAAIKAAYRTLIREHHPDKLVAAGMPPEFVAVATEKMKRINAAYDQICRAKGMN